MLADIGIYQSANALIRHHGDGAAFHAAMRADAMLYADDLTAGPISGARAW